MQWELARCSAATLQPHLVMELIMMTKVFVYFLVQCHKFLTVTRVLIVLLILHLYTVSSYLRSFRQCLSFYYLCSVIHLHKFIRYVTRHSPLPLLLSIFPVCIKFSLFSFLIYHCNVLFVPFSKLPRCSHVLFSILL